jgi:hypothetical protein
MCQRERRIHFDRLAALLYALVIRVRKEKDFCQIGINNDNGRQRGSRFPLLKTFASPPNTSGIRWKTSRAVRRDHEHVVMSGAAMIRNRRESGTGDVVHADKHIRQIVQEMR